MKPRLSISSATVAFGLLLGAGFLAIVGTSVYSLNELKVGGPLYADIKLGNDLVADILPPHLPHTTMPDRRCLCGRLAVNGLARAFVSSACVSGSSMASQEPS